MPLYMQTALESQVYESPLCSYTLSVQSLYGCPQECPATDGSLCSEHGLCSFDHSNNKSHCYCYDTHGGNDCSIAIDSNLDNYTKPKPNNTEYVRTFEQTNHVNVTYDLNPFQLTNDQSAYEIFDKFDNYHIYYIGINQLIPKPAECLSIDLNVTEAFAFQLNNITKQCHVLGTVANWTLFDESDETNDPARGSTVIYTNGSECSGFGRNREFSVSLVCPDGPKVFDVATERNIFASVQETETCKYDIQIESAFACPYECLTEIRDDGEFDICSNHGICAADPFAGYVRCLCDDGWDGAECQSEISLAPTKDPTVYPSDVMKPSTTKLSINPTLEPTLEPTVSDNSTKSPSKAAGTEKVKNTNTAHIVLIVGLCVGGILAAIVIGWTCYKRRLAKHDEFNSYTQFDENRDDQVL